jgi:hypothetical protein
VFRTHAYSVKLYASHVFCKLYAARQKCTKTILSLILVTIDFTVIFTIIQDEIPYSCEVVIDSFRDKTPQLSVIEACIVVRNIYFLMMILCSYFVFITYSLSHWRILFSITSIFLHFNVSNFLNHVLMTSINNKTIVLIILITD